MKRPRAVYAVAMTDQELDDVLDFINVGRAAIRLDLAKTNAPIKSHRILNGKARRLEELFREALGIRKAVSV